MREKSILLMGATFSTDNMGVSALTAGSIEAGLHTWPNARILLLDYGKERRRIRYDSANGPVMVDLLNMRFSKRFYLRNHIAILILLAMVLRLLPRRLRQFMFLRNMYFKEISSADFAVAISGGDSFSDIYGLRRFFYSSLPQILVQMIGNKLIFLPQTVGPFNHWIARTMAGYILKRATLVYSRDYAGLEEMQSFLNGHFDPARFRFCYDVGFVVNPVRPEKVDLEGFAGKDGISTTVGLNVSGLLWMGGYKRNNQFGLKTDYKLLIKELIDHLISGKGATVILIPHVFEGGNSSESDQSACERLYLDLKCKYGDRLYWARGRYDQSEIKYIIGLCDFFIGSRMHACIAALSQCIPTVPVAYSKKFIGVMETIGVESYIADPRSMNEHEILHTVDRAWTERDSIRQHLKSKMLEVNVRVLNLFKEIDGALAGKG
ncbi:MAG: polysaccharide pyruvyl transferase family protein [Syntrophales bacterium]